MKLSGFFIKASISFVLILTVLSFFIYFANKYYHSNQIHLAERKLNSVSFLISNNLDSKKTITNVLNGFASYKGSIDSAEFSNLAKHIFKESGGGILCIQWAPDAVIKYIYPIQGNEKAIGLKLLEYEKTKDDTRNSIKTRKPHLNGPIPLIQGGVGIVYRVPVFALRNVDNSNKSDFIGFAAVVLKLDDFLKACGLFESDKNSVAIKFEPAAKEKKFFKNEVFFGKKEVFLNENFSKTLSVTNGKWIIGVKVENFIFTPRILFFLFLVRFIVSFSIAYLIYKNLKNQSLIRLKNEELTQKNIQIEKEIKEKMLLMNEIHHRVKNNFQLVSSLARLQSYELNDPKSIEAFQEFSNRVSTIALTHEQLLYKSESTNLIEIKSYVTTLIKNLTTKNDLKNIEFKLKLSEKKLALKELILLGIIINELISNSFKYAFKEQGNGEINLKIKKAGTGFELIYLDNGIGFDENILEKDSESFGIDLIKSISEQLDGELKIVIENGFHGFQLNFKSAEA